MLGASFGSLPPGLLFRGRYEIIECKKSGGQGAVYVASDREAHGRKRALKVMLPDLLSDPDLVRRFAQEAAITASIESEHLVEIFEAGVDPETRSPYIVMELLRGEDLSGLLERCRGLAMELAEPILTQVARTLDKTHAAGIVHRDLKPENLFLTLRDDGSPRIRILDFGISRIMSEEAKAKQTRVVGTPMYMAPEQIRGEGTIGAAADIYALGHVAFALLVGTPYYEDESAKGIHALLLRVVAGGDEPATERARRRGVELPSGFDAWFDRATHSDPAARFESASALVNALLRVFGRDGQAASHTVLGLGIAPPPSMPRLQTADGTGPHGPAPSTGSPAPGAPTGGAAGRTALTAPLEFGSPTGTIATGLASDSAPHSPAKSRRPAVIGIAAALAVALVGGVFVVRAITAPAPPRPAKPDGSSNATGAGSSDARPLGTDSLVIAPTRVLPPTATPTSAGTASTGHPVDPPTPRAVKTAAPQAPQPTASVTIPPRPPPPPPPPATPNCSPPFTVDTNGNKHAKPECL